MGAIASPSVRKLARERGVDIDALAETLGRSTIAREDILGTTAASPSTQSQATALWDVDHAAWGPVSKEPLNRIAQVASATVSAAHALVPAVTHHDSADVGRIEATRSRLKEEGAEISALAFHVSILARCLKEYPRFNSSLAPDGMALVLKHYVHVGIAVDTPHGLVVPVIRDAHSKRIPELSAEIADFADRARNRRIRGHEMGGASMTISNLGAIGGEAFTPMVNPPEVAILGISRTRTRPVWDGSAFKPRPMVPLDLSYDHRVINGADAARFLSRYCALVEDPDGLLV